MPQKYNHKQSKQASPIAAKLDVCADLTQLMQLYQGTERHQSQNAHSLHSRLTRSLSPESSENLYGLSPEKRALAGRAMKALEAKNFNNATSLIAELSE